MLRRKFPVWLLGIGCLFGSLLGGRSSNYHDVAQVGDGPGVRTVFLISNGGGEAANVRIRLIQPDGSALRLTLGAETDSSFDVVVPAGGMVKLVTAGTSDPLQRGWARLFSTLPVGAQVLFEIRANGALVTQAAVESPGGLRNSSVFIDQGEDSNSGIAVANLSAFGEIRVRLTLRDENGNTVATRDLILPALGQEAKFIFELFPTAGTIRGTLTVQASGRVTLVALQQTGLVLGTVPPVF